MAPKLFSLYLSRAFPLSHASFSRNNLSSHEAALFRARIIIITELANADTRKKTSATSHNQRSRVIS